MPRNAWRSFHAYEAKANTIFSIAISSIGWSRKPGAFRNYRYKSDLFPTHRFRMAYDALKASTPARASKAYLKILHLAARESEVLVDGALAELLKLSDQPPVFEEIRRLVEAGSLPDRTEDVQVKAVDVGVYDGLLPDFASEALSNGRAS